MNRFTRYVAERHNMKPGSAYPWLPYEVSKGIVLDDVEHRPETSQVVEYYNVATIVTTIGRDGSITSQEYV